MLTIRDLICQGADLDTPICIEVRTLDKNGNCTGVYYSYEEIPTDSFTTNNGILTIMANVNDVGG
jgi:hypothetical protein